MNGTGNIYDAVKGKALLAPMLATTDIPFRTICRENGAAMTFTEMVSAAGIVRASSRSFRNAIFTTAERPVTVQLVAAKRDDVALAVRELSALHPDAFDLNCGCPNERICEAGAGANLLDDLPRLGAVVEAAVRASQVPVSVKVRMRGSSRHSQVTDIVRVAEQSGAACVTVHSRAKNTPYDTPADWDALATAVAAVRIPVIGNGDVLSPADALRMMRDTGCHAVMIARGCLGSPWIFDEVDAGNSVGILDCLPSRETHSATINRHLRMLLNEFGELRAIPRIRKHAMWYARFFEDWDLLRRRIFSVVDAELILETVAAFFSAAPRRLDPDSTEARRIETAFRKRVLFWTTESVQAEG
jgi:tRNA-dihydrouridine synthase B